MQRTKPNHFQWLGVIRVMRLGWSSETNLAGLCFQFAVFNCALNVKVGAGSLRFLLSPFSHPSGVTFGVSLTPLGIAFTNSVTIGDSVSSLILAIIRVGLLVFVHCLANTQWSFHYWLSPKAMAAATTLILQPQRGQKVTDDFTTGAGLAGSIVWFSFDFCLALNFRRRASDHPGIGMPL